MASQRSSLTPPRGIPASAAPPAGALLCAAATSPGPKLYDRRLAERCAGRDDVFFQRDFRVSSWDVMVISWEFIVISWDVIVVG